MKRNRAYIVEYKDEDGYTQTERIAAENIVDLYNQIRSADIKPTHIYDVFYNEL